MRSALPESRNATEDAILDAARQALSEISYARLTMDVIARRAFVSRTSLYFYFPNKRAVVDRLIQRTFHEMYEASSPYLEGREDPRRELHASLAAVVRVAERDSHLLRLAAKLAGEGDDRMPPEWAPYIQRFIDGAARRIARDQQRGVAPTDIPPRISAQAMLAMVERHIVIDVVIGGGDARVAARALAELYWRAVYCGPKESQ